MRAPMMLITPWRPAALDPALDGARFRVGPDSAGAIPGPPATRRGGPLGGHRDVMVGKLIPDSSQDFRRASRSVRSTPRRYAPAFAKLAHEIATAHRRGCTPTASSRSRSRHGERDQEISVQRGYD